TVDELHRLRILEEVDPPRVLDEKIAGDDGAVHQGPGIVAHARMEAGNQRAEIDLHETEDSHKNGSGLAKPGRRPVAAVRREPTHDPDAGRTDQAGDGEMHGETELRD